MFYACSLDPENCGKMFVNVLVNIFTSSPNPEWRLVGSFKVELFSAFYLYSCVEVDFNFF